VSEARADAAAEDASAQEGTEPMSKFAEGTSVPVEKTKMEIERLLTRYGASHYGVMHSPTSAQVLFQACGRNVRFDLRLPPLTSPEFRSGRRRPEDLQAAEVRRRWRALAMVIKAKLEAVQSGITTFEEEFLAHLVLETGETVAEQMIPKLPAPSSNVRQLPGTAER
jgi:hypothetical protein